jgi:hypothetical protein
MEAGMEAEAEMETAFSFVGTAFSVKRTGDCGRGGSLFLMV